MSNDVVVVETEARITVIGDVGPRGPQGEIGPQGPQGPVGPAAPTTLINEYTFTGNGSQTAFTFAGVNAPSAGSILIAIDGVAQAAAAFGYVNSGANLVVTFTEAPPNGAAGTARVLGYVAPVGVASTAAALGPGADRTKLDGIAAGATANSTDAQLRDRSTHTGTQLVTTISNLGAGTVTATGAPTARSLADRFGGWITPQDFGAVGDGIADDTVAVQAAITAAAASGKPVVFGPETYAVTTLTAGGAGIKLLGCRGATTVIRLNGGASNRLLSVTGSGFYCEGIKFDGNKAVATSLNMNGINIAASCLSAKLVDVEVCNVHGSNTDGTGHGILVVGAADDGAGYDFVRGSSHHNDAEGLTVWYADNVNVSGGHYYSNGRSGIACDFKNMPNVVKRLSIDGVRAYSNGLSGIVVGNFSSGGVYTHDNTNTDSCHVTNNYCYTNAEYGIMAYGDFISVVGNTCNGNNTSNGVYGGIVFSARYSTCKNNRCADNSSVGGYGIDSGATAYSEVSGNICVRNYVNFNPGGSIATIFSNNQSYDYHATGVYVIPVEAGAGNFPYECRGLIMRNNIFGVHAAGKVACQILHGVRDLVFNENHFHISGTGRMQDALFWNGHSSCQMEGNTHSVAATSNHDYVITAGVLRVTDFEEYVTNVQTNPTLTQVTTWSRDTIGSAGVAHLVPGAVGSGYTTASVEFTGGGGTGAAASARIWNGQVLGYHMTSYGTGYTSAPTVTITGNGTGAAATAVRGYQVPTGKRLTIYANAGMLIHPGTVTMPGLGPHQLGAQDFIELRGQYGGWRVVSWSRKGTADGMASASSIAGAGEPATFSAAGVNLLATGQTALFPGALLNRRFIPITAHIRVATASGALTTPAVVRIGNDGTFSNIAASTTLTGMDTANEVAVLTMATPATAVSVNSAGLSIDVTTAAVGPTTLTVDVYVRGILI